MPEIVNKLDYRIRQTRECVYCQNPCNGSILNLSKVDLLFSDIVKWNIKIEWTEQSNSLSNQLWQLQLHFKKRINSFVAYHNDYLLEFHSLISIHDG